MKNINETETLNNAIILLQAKRDSELVLLKEQFHEAYESLRPINIIKSAFKEVASPNVQGSIVDNAIGLGTGFISKKILVGSSHNPLKRIMGSMIQYAITNLVAKHADGIKSTGVHLISNFLKHRKESKAARQHENN